MLNIAGQQLTNLTGYNEYITDVVIATIVYLSAFTLVIKTLIAGRKKRAAGVDAKVIPAASQGAGTTPETGKEKEGEGV